MKLLFIGPPFAGKGTQAQMLSKHFKKRLHYSLPHISTGEMLRDMAERGHPLGLEAKAIINQGNFFPDEKMNPLALERLKYGDCKEGFILDGYPRNVYQAMEFDKHHTLDVVICLDVPPMHYSVLKDRMLARRECKLCRVTYGLENTPKTSEECHLCGHPLYRRADDGNLEVFEKRQKEYKEQTADLVSHYVRKLFMVNAKRSTSEVFEDILMQFNITLPRL